MPATKSRPRARASSGDRAPELRSGAAYHFEIGRVWKVIFRQAPAALLLLVGAMPAVAQVPAGSFDASGRFRPMDGPQRLRRSQIGDHCVVDLQQAYRLDGSLAGGMTLDFRIYVGGPCGEPPGTFDEHWIAHGDYAVTVGDSEIGGVLIYLAEVEAGSRVDGTLILADGLNGALAVEGRFADGFMSYRGRLSPQAADP